MNLLRQIEKIMALDQLFCLLVSISSSHAFERLQAAFFGALIRLRMAQQKDNKGIISFTTKKRIAVQ